MGEKAQHAKPIVDGDDHYALLAQMCAVEHGVRTGTTDKPASMDPDHDRERSTAVKTGVDTFR